MDDQALYNVSSQMLVLNTRRPIQRKGGPDPQIKIADLNHIIYV